MEVLEEIQLALNGGDPVVRQWLLIRGYFWQPVLCILYVLVVMKIGPALMKNRKPFHLRNLMVAYNLALVLIYIVCLLSVLYYAFTHDVHGHICTRSAVVEGEPTYWIARVGHVIYLLKYVEFLDTIFFVLRKKDDLITGLHVFHHGSLPFVGWVMMRTEISGLQFLPGMLNAFVHVIMYSYYGLAAIGPSVRKYLWWKKYLTIMQMGQFVLIFLFAVVFIPISGCQASLVGAAIDVIFGLTFLALFYNYYQNTYKKTKIHGSGMANGAAVSTNGDVKYRDEVKAKAT